MKLTPFTISLAATVAVYLVSGFAISQPVGIGTNIPSANAALEITATDKGMFVPRLTTLERNAISTSANEAGLLVFDVDQKLFYYWNSTTWLSLIHI